MTLEEAIKHAEEVAEKNQRVVDTGIVYDDVTIDMLYCDDTEVIEEHLANYQWCAEKHRQLAAWLKDYKRLLEQEPCEDAISRQAVINSFKNWLNDNKDPRSFEEVVKEMPSAISSQKEGLNY